MKRYSRRFWRTKYGKTLKRIEERIVNLRLSVFVYDWYHGLYNGTILTLLSILNLLSIPFVEYYEQVHSLEGLKRIIIIQIFLNTLYQLDLILIIIIQGLRRVLFKSPMGIKLEIGI